MADLLNKSMGVIQEEGPTAFVRKSLGHISGLFKGYLRGIDWRIAKLRGRKRFSVAGGSAIFTLGSRESIENTKWRISTERGVLIDLLNEVEDDEVFFDIGANTGVYTCFAAGICSQVVSFEPYPPNIQKLKRNVELNNGNVLIIDKALSNRSEKNSFSVPEKDEPGHGHATFGENSGKMIEVQSVRGDQLITEDEVPQPNIVKIDVEGSEPLVINGLEEALEREECRLVYCEIHLPAEHRQSAKDFGCTAPEVWELIEDLGFEVKKVWGRGSPDLHVKAKKR